MTHRPLTDLPERTTPRPQPAETTEAPQGPLVAPGYADVRIEAASPEAARLVAQTLRDRYAGAEQRSYPDAPDGGTRLHLTVDTTRAPDAAEAPRPWPVAGRPHHDECAVTVPRRPTPTPHEPSADRLTQ
ncbi:hypothetical protein [Streptomyces sp. NPDC018045]|uniref:hypothetical protein n=1 Tax=Streptomyces sp. NPDC018045 TaxID=3365037 RepID=UPI00379C8E5E